MTRLAYPASALALLAAVSLLAAEPALAGTLEGKVRLSDGTQVGTMRYRADAGVANRITVRVVDTSVSELIVRDSADRLRARGDCESIDRHTASCPYTEASPPLIIATRDRGDEVAIEDACGRDRCAGVRVLGGSGDDRITGGGEFMGGPGDDLLRGIDARYNWDRLTGGPGHDRMLGGGTYKSSLPDDFFDGETDAQAARDVVVAGNGPGAVLDYSRRRESMRIDLSKRRLAPEGDRVRGIVGVVSGHGDDVLLGTAGANRLDAGPGTDRIEAGEGRDIISGGLGDDRLFGGAGRDSLGDSHWYGLGRGNGSDLFDGGEGRDEIRSHDSFNDEPIAADEVRCDARDLPVQSDALDDLEDCVAIKGWEIADLELLTRPTIDADGATFTLRCGITEIEQTTDPETGFSDFTKRCRGELRLTAASGDALGSQDFVFEVEDFTTPWVTVTVPLTQAGVEEVTSGAVIQVEAEARSNNGYTFQIAGYRAPLADG